MSCSDAHALMSAAFDGFDRAPLEPHLAACPDCIERWQALEALDALFRSQPMVEPPAGFAPRVTLRIEREKRLVPSWSRSLKVLLVMLGGLAAMALSTLAIVHGFRTIGPSGAGEASAQGAWAALLSLAPAWARPWAAGTLGAAGMLALAAVLAIVWFAVLVVPHSTRLGRRAG